MLAFLLLIAYGQHVQLLVVEDLNPELIIVAMFLPNLVTLRLVQ